MNARLSAVKGAPSADSATTARTRESLNNVYDNGGIAPLALAEVLLDVLFGARPADELRQQDIESAVRLVSQCARIFKTSIWPPASAITA